MDETKAKRLKKFSEVFSESRIHARKSQEWMAFELGKTRRTVQNWESGRSAPDLFETLEWFRAINTNPFPYFLKLLYPDSIKDLSPASSDEKIEEAFNDLTHNLSVADKRALLYLYGGNHGSSPYSVIQLMLAHLHSPIISRISNAIMITGSYELNKQLGTLICKDNIQPDIDNLSEAIKKAEYAAIHHAEGYTNFIDK